MVGGAAFMLLAIGNGLDRMAHQAPAISARLPQVFVVNAREVAGEDALARDPRAALALATALVARAPVEPDSTALLGAARLANGDDAGADRAFRVAGTLGWRVPVTQAYLEQVAVDDGDLPMAARRMDALLRLDPRRLHDPATLAPFEDDPAGQAALVYRMLARPLWLGWYIGEADQMPAALLARRVPTLTMLADRGLVLGCAAIAPAVPGAGWGASGARVIAASSSAASLASCMGLREFCAAAKGAKQSRRTARYRCSMDAPQRRNARSLHPKV